MSEIEDELRRVFLGQIPPPYDYIDFKQLPDKLTKALEKQNVESIRDLNFAELMLDLAEIIQPYIELYFKSEGKATDEKIKQFLLTNRSTILANYLVMIQGNTMSPSEKADVAFFWRKMLQTFTMVYSAPMIADQEEFIRQTISDEKEQLDLAASHHQRIPIWFKGNSTQFELLASKLAEAGFVSGSATFLQSFETSCNFSCNWTGTMRSFMYLIREISLENSISEPVFVELADRFTIKGKQKESKDFRQALLKITQLVPNSMISKGGNVYFKLYKICQSVFASR